MKLKNTSEAVTLYLNLNKHLENTYFNEITRSVMSADIVSKIYSDTATTCALCEADMVGEYANDDLKLCHPCYIKLMTKEIN